MNCVLHGLTGQLHNVAATTHENMRDNDIMETFNINT